MLTFLYRRRHPFRLLNGGVFPFEFEQGLLRRGRGVGVTDKVSGKKIMKLIIVSREGIRVD